MKLEDLRPLSGNGKRLYVETYGCQMNVGDSEILVSIMQDEGYRYTEDIAQADVILVNTCSIRDNAEQRIWGRLREFHRYKRARKGLVVGIVGCMAERLREELFERETVVDVVAGPDSYREPAEAGRGCCCRRSRSKRAVVAGGDLRRYTSRPARPQRRERLHVHHARMQ